jgi:heme o synthase
MSQISSKWSVWHNYLFVLKPRETSLLAAIGLFSALIAAHGSFDLGRLAFILLTITIGSAGCNGLTNYLDRNLDARMVRTKNRVLPSGRVSPPEKALPLIISLIVISLIFAWLLHPLCFVVGIIGVISSAVWRKTISCTFLGIVAGVSPVLIGWLAIKPVFDLQILLLCLLIAFWIPVHVWSIMIANREDYFSAGLHYFPLNLPVTTVVTTLMVLSVCLYAISLLLYFLTDFRLLYFIGANALGIAMIIANARLLMSTTSRAAWHVYKLSSFPYLGLIFLLMVLDIWIR